MGNLIYETETFAIKGAVFEVYKTMGAGFLESVYQECLEEEFKRRGIPFLPQAEIRISYKDKALRQFYKADMLCYDKIILLINFGHYPGVEIKRIAL